ncbi:hypothetical protein [Pseudoroseicyclus tamaricis]|uniref:Uncharacterized protein n=1 Tax=Pseudoroseicyclus tamaricis TaxID=2705421 RepID=A0A6B2K1D8_9RHOB|nr:hypothetical protein [Pseudoroseicyclus tamaricis]NDV00156.1 hypothetical protein [Pseudoroseicyclus tamaricis]
MTRRLLILGLILLAIGLAPVASVALASFIAERAGCELHEGFTNPCLVGGRDIGGTLYTMFVAGWYMLLSLPVALVGLVMLVIGGISALRARRRRT